MPVKFEWTDEEQQWPELPPEPAPAPSRRHPFWAPLLLALLALAAGFLYQQLQRRTTAAAARVEADIFHTHRLVQRAVLAADVELFAAQLSGRSPRWAAAQEQLVREGIYVERPAWALKPVSDDGGQAVAVTLSPDLTAAEVRYRQPYAWDVGGGVTRTVTLEQTAVYRLGQVRWLLAPPETSFWGEWLTLDEGRLALAYPARDREVAERLAPELAAGLEEMCLVLADLGCPPAWRLTVRLDTSPASLARSADLASLIDTVAPLELPAPTLVGLPVDEAGYEVLRQGYMAALASAAITALVEYDCCRHGPFYRALLDRQLSRLDLRSWPMEPAEYEQLWEDALWTAGRLGATLYWNETSVTPARAGDMRQVYAMIEFLGQAAVPGTSVAEMQRRLMPARSYQEWVYSMLPEGTTAALFMAEWLNFVYRRSAPEAEPPPATWPAQQVQLLCRSFNDGATFYRYHLGAGRWSEEIVRPRSDTVGFATLSPLPDGKSYLVYEDVRDGEQQQIRLLLQRPEETILLAEADVTPQSASGLRLNFTGVMDPTGRYAVLAGYEEAAGPVRYHLLDVAACSEESCDLQPLAAIPVWSPDGEATLLEGAAAATGLWQHRLYLGDERGRNLVEVGLGGAPFWLDGERYGYVRSGAGDRTEVVVAAADQAPVVWLDSSRLATLLTPRGGRPPDGLIITGAQVNPAGAGQLIISAATRRDSQEGTSFFWLEGRGERLSLLAESQGPYASHFSPDGRWWVLALFSLNSNETTLHLFDLAQGGVRSIQSIPGRAGYLPPAWSADGQWLLLGEENGVLLLAPESGWQRLIPHGFAGCYRMTWSAGA